MSKAFGGIKNLVNSKQKKEQTKVRAAHFARVEGDRQFRAELQAIKDRLDLFGEDALTEDEKKMVAEASAFFCPEPRRPGQLV